MFAARALALLVAVSVVAGCGAGAADKAGGSHAPTVLTVADSDSSDQVSTPALEHFAQQVDSLSHGSLHIHIVFQAAGAATPDVEERVIRAVQSDRFDLGWIGARAWDEVGVKSLRALQAPFLVTSTRLLDRVATSPIGTEMLSGLSRAHVVGLALVPDLLRHPIGLTRAFVSPSDFGGARIRINPSRVTAAIMRSLGALPVEISNDQIGYAIGRKRVDGEELSLATGISPSVATANVTFFSKAITLFANARKFDRLSDDQRRILRTAAAETVRHVIATYPTDSKIINGLCANRRRVVLATLAERAALVRKVRPVYRMLEGDAQSRRFIEQIREWKRTTPGDPPLALAAGCSKAQPPAPAVGAARPPSDLDGTYRWVITVTDAHKRWGPHADLAGLPMVSTAVLRHGTWEVSGPDPQHDTGTFTIHGDRVRFVWPRIPAVLVFRFTRDRDGTIHWKPMLPMDEGDQFVWAYKPWKRLGPPTRL